MANLYIVFVLILTIGLTFIVLGLYNHKKFTTPKSIRSYPRTYILSLLAVIIGFGILLLDISYLLYKLEIITPSK